MVVLRHGLSSELVLIAHGVPWAKYGSYYQNYHSVPGPNGQGNQRVVRRAFAGAAIAAFGTTGKTPYKGKNMPSVAVKVASGVLASGEVQALKSTTQAKKEQNRQAAHQAAVARWGGIGAAAF